MSYTNFHSTRTCQTLKSLHLTGSDLDELELGFMDDFCSLLQAAHFRVLSSDDWQSACDNDFTVSLSSLLVLKCSLHVQSTLDKREAV